MKNSADAYCPISDIKLYKDSLKLWRDAALMSIDCHPDVVNNYKFFEWESCTSDLNKVYLLK